jgi:signal peptidase II
MLFFGVLALAIVVSDQLLKLWVVDNFKMDKPSPVVGDWLRINLIHNHGGLFGVLQGSASLFAIVTIGVVAVLVGLQLTSGWRNWLVTLTLGLLLGGAVGNFIDRIQYQYVVDFADIGIGQYRFYIFNIADSAVTVAIVIMLVMPFLAPRLGMRFDLGGSEQRPEDRAGKTNKGAVVPDPPRGRSGR